MLPLLHAAEDPRSAAKSNRMAQWREMRYGLFIHWSPGSKTAGVYQGKEIPGNPEWIMRTASISREDYRKIAADADPRRFAPAELVAFAKDSGFKYVVLTAKGPDGFALFDSKHSDFDAVDVFPSKRDLIKEFSTACVASNMPFGFQYSVNTDWYHPGGGLNYGRPWDPTQAGPEKGYFTNVALPQVKELLANSENVSQMIFDQGEGFPPELASRFPTRFKPGVVISQGFDPKMNADYQFRAGVPRETNSRGADWEIASSINHAPTSAQDSPRLKTDEAIIRELVTTAAGGGNYLLDVALDADGALPDEAKGAIAGIAKWLGTHGASVYGTQGSPFMVHPWEGVATQRNNGDGGSSLYIHLFKAPGDRLALGNLVTPPVHAKIMGDSVDIPIHGRPGAWSLDTSGLNLSGVVPVIEIRMKSKPKIGLGPICEGPTGNFKLAISRASYSGANRVDRSESSSDLRVTGFAGGADSGHWEVFSERGVEVSLQLTATAETSTPGKRLVLSLDGREIGPVEFVSGAPPRSGTRQYVSKSFLLPPGSSRIGISGEPGDKNTSLLTALGIELVQN